MRQPTLRRPRRQAGFSIIEVLVGFLILLLVLIGLLPIFTRAIIENIAGREATIVANHGRSRIEAHKSLSFNNWELRVEDGNMAQVVNYWAGGDPDEIGDERWDDSPGSEEQVLWQRTTTIRQFGINGVTDTDGDGVLDTIVGLEDADHDGYWDNPLDAGTPPGSVHVKELRVLIESQRETTFGSGDPAELTLRGAKAF